MKNEPAPQLFQYTFPIDDRLVMLTIDREVGLDYLIEVAKFVKGLENGGRN